MRTGRATVLFKCQVCKRLLFQNMWIRIGGGDEVTGTGVVNCYCPECSRRLVKEIRDAIEREKRRERKAVSAS